MEHASCTVWGIVAEMETHALTFPVRRELTCVGCVTTPQSFIIRVSIAKCGVAYRTGYRTRYWRQGV